MALLRLADRWALSQPGPPVLSILTVDHGLRAGSEAEAARVAAWSAELGRPHVTLKWDGRKLLTGIQAKARKARYDLLSGWCLANGAQALLTAHTMDDQAETVLMRLRRTTSPDSLSGIPARGQWNGLPVLRPLLGLRRKALRSALEEMGQGWIEDPSNNDTRFERVRVRGALGQLDGDEGAVERLAALAGDCSRTVRLLDRNAGRWISLWVEETGAGVCFAEAEPFRVLPPALQQRILSWLVVHHGGGRLRPERDELQRLAQWLSTSAAPPRATLAGAIVGKRKTQFWVTREPSRIDATPQTVPETGKLLWDGRFMITAPPGSTIVPAGHIPGELGKDVPAFARLAYPLVRLPPNAADLVESDIAFVRIGPS